MHCAPQAVQNSRSHVSLPATALQGQAARFPPESQEDHGDGDGYGWCRRVALAASALVLYAATMPLRKSIAIALNYFHTR
jgi:hypothetical protein